MDRTSEVRGLVLTGLAAFGSGLLRLLGGWDPTLQALLGFMAADWITGVLAAGIFHRSSKTPSGALSSRAGFRGLARKCAVLVAVFLGALLDRTAETAFVRPMICLFFTGNEGLSVLENLGLMGLPYPAFLRDMLEVLRKKGDGGDPS